MNEQDNAINRLREECASLEDCSIHYLPGSVGVSNLLMMAKLFEKQALSLDPENTIHLDFGVKCWSGSYLPAHVSYLYDPEMTSLVHNWFYERMDELKQLFINRSGDLSLLSGTISLKPDDVDLLFPQDLKLEFAGEQMEAHQKRAHRAYVEKASLKNAVGEGGFLGPKKAM